MFDGIINFVKDNCWTILIVAALIFLFIYWLFKGDSKGTWDDSYYYDDRKPMGQHIRAAGESKGEAECRYVLESIFKQKFPKRRPKFLFNSKISLLVLAKEPKMDCADTAIIDSLI